MREPGQGEHLPLRPDRLRPAAPRPRSGDARVRRPAPLPRVERARRCGSSPTSPTSTTRSSSGPTRGPAVAGDHRPSARRSGSRRWTASASPGPTTSPTPPSTSTQMVAMIGELVEIGRAYVTDDGVYLSVEIGRGLRPARPPVARRHARRRRRARGLRRRAASATRPTSCCGSWPSRASRRGRRRGATGRPGLAQRVRRDEPRPPRRGLRPARRRAWT